MTKVGDAWEALSKALLSMDPLCLDDDRFTDDDTNPDHVRELCVMCPLYGLCKNYAMAARPEGGIWAGQRWARAPRTPKDES